MKTNLRSPQIFKKKWERTRIGNESCKAAWNENFEDEISCDEAAFTSDRGANINGPSQSTSDTKSKCNAKSNEDTACNENELISKESLISKELLITTGQLISSGQSNK